MRKLFLLLLGLVVAVGVAGCDSNGGPGPMALVRFMHASADAGPVTILADGEGVASNVTYSGTTTQPTVSEYFEVPVRSDASIQVQDADGNAVISTTAGEAGFQEDAQYTVVVAGAASAPLQTPQPIVLRDRFETTLGAQQVGIRIIHASGFAGAVDVYLTPPGTNLENVDPLIPGFQFTQDFPGGFTGQFAPQDVTQEGSELSVTQAGSKQPVLQLRVGGDEGLPVSPGQFITGVAVDAPQSDPPVGALIHVDVPGS